MSVSSHTSLNDGNRIPVIGFGTYAPETYPKSKAEEATELAIKVGYRHIDGAYMYSNEAEVGRAIHKKISDGTIRREDLFLTGKLWCTFHRPNLVQKGLQRSLEALNMKYLDLFLIHVPVEFQVISGKQISWDGALLNSSLPFRNIFQAMEQCKDAGLVKSIGVSNFNRRQLELILKKRGLKYKPVCNQVECHVYLNQEKLLKFCNENDIVLVAYSVLGSSRDVTFGVAVGCPVLLEDPVLNGIAQRIGRTPAQVALRYLLQRGIVVLAKSYTEHRIKENLQVFDFQLGEEDMKSLYALNKNMRYGKMPM
ncbi:estradiol 17 beta-dehydrogenase 5-like [Lithobates pipiens]